MTAALRRRFRPLSVSRRPHEASHSHGDPTKAKQLATNTWKASTHSTHPPPHAKTSAKTPLARPPPVTAAAAAANRTNPNLLLDDDATPTTHIQRVSTQGIVEGTYAKEAHAKRTGTN